MDREVLTELHDPSLFLFVIADFLTNFRQTFDKKMNY